jgi:hypothetical protein
VAGAKPERALATISDREYRSLDEVGEELAPVQPERRCEATAVRRAPKQAWPIETM